MSTVTISMPENLKAYVEDQVKTKGFGNVSEYFRSLVREAQKKEAQDRLETLLMEGLESNAIPITPEFMRDFRRELAERVEKARAEHEKKSQ